MSAGRDGSREPCLLRPGFLSLSPRLLVGQQDFGDSLSRIVISHVSGLVPIHVSNQFSGKVLGIGSILHHALAEKDVVWGSGAIRNEPIVPPRDTQFLAVRGPWTQALIRADVPSVFGDPSILLPEIYTPNPGPRYSVGVVPHYVDKPYVTIADPSVLLIDVTLAWRRVVDLIACCDVILSSSLHGLVVAESYGIPAAWITISDRIVGGTLESTTIFLGTGRSEREPVPWERGVERNGPRSRSSAALARWATAQAGVAEVVASHPCSQGRLGRTRQHLLVQLAI